MKDVVKKNLIMNRKTYEKCSIFHSNEIDKIEGIIHLLNDDKVYKIAVVDDTAIYIADHIEDNQILTTYKQEDYDHNRVVHGGENIKYKASNIITLKEEKNDSIKKDGN